MILQNILNVMVYNIILFMNLSRSYEINKSGTIFVAKRIDVLNILTNNAWPPTLNLKKLLFTCSIITTK